jgi:hypothetical protein
MNEKVNEFAQDLHCSKFNASPNPGETFGSNQTISTPILWRGITRNIPSFIAQIITKGAQHLVKCNQGEAS